MLGQGLGIFKGNHAGGLLSVDQYQYLLEEYPDAQASYSLDLLNPDYLSSNIYPQTALEFDATDDDVTFTAPTVGTGNMCMTFLWQVPSGAIPLLGLTGLSQYSLWISNTTWYTRDSAFVGITGPDIRNFVGQWMQCTLNRTSTTNVDLYVNGFYVNSWTVDAARTFDFTYLNYSNSNVNAFKYADFRMWDSAATAEQIKKMWNGGAIGDNDFVGLGTPVREYRFDGTGTSTTLADYGTDGEDGTLNNFPASGMWGAADLPYGALVELRRSSDGATEVFYPNSSKTLGLNSLNSSGTDLSTWLSTDDGYVSKWFDQSNGITLFSNTVSEHPQLLDSGAFIEKNGVKSLYFNGSNQLSAEASSKSSMQFLHQAADASYVNLVAFGDTVIPDAAYALWGTNDNTSAHSGNYLRYDDRSSLSRSNRIADYATNGSAVVCNTEVNDSLKPNQTNLVFANLDLDNSTAADRVEYYVDDVAITVNNTSTNSPSSAIASTDFTIGTLNGGSFPMTGYASELVFWPSNQSANRAGIQNNIISRKGTLYPGTATNGLLYDYPNAAAAYSVRQLTIYDNEYKAPLVAIRRSSDNAVEIFYADSNYDISLSSLSSTGQTLSSWVGANDGFVAVWYDQSGNSNDATQTTAANQPQIISSGSLLTVTGGRPTINWDGVNDYLDTQYSPNTLNLTIEAVVERDVTGGNDMLVAVVDNGGIAAYMSWYNGGLDKYVLSGTTTQTATETTNLQEIGWYADGTNQYYYIDGSQIGSTVSAVNQVNSKTSKLGAFQTGTLGLDGNVSEFIIWAFDQTGNRTGIQTNINDFYSIY